MSACCSDSSTTTLELSEQGCYRDSASDPAFVNANLVPNIDNLVPSLCVAECQTRGFSYAGIRVSVRHGVSTFSYVGMSDYVSYAGIRVSVCRM